MAWHGDAVSGITPWANRVRRTRSSCRAAFASTQWSAISPHKPLLVLLALGRFAATGSSELPWSEAETQLAGLIAEFGPATTVSPAQRAAYPFTRLRSDRVWQLDQDVPMDKVGPLATVQVSGRFDSALEAALLADPRNVLAAARGMVSSHFPDTVAPDVLTAVGLDPDAVLSIEDTLPDPQDASKQRRRWPN